MEENVAPDMNIERVWITVITKALLRSGMKKELLAAIDDVRDHSLTPDIGAMADNMEDRVKKWSKTIQLELEIENAVEIDDTFELVPVKR